MSDIEEADAPEESTTDVAIVEEKDVVDDEADDKSIPQESTADDAVVDENAAADANVDEKNGNSSRSVPEESTTDDAVINEKNVSDAGVDEELGEKSRDFEFTESTYQSYGSKLKNTCTGVVIGFLLFFGSIGLLLWNEGRAVARYKDIDEARENVVEVILSKFQNISDPTTSEFDNKLIHITGPLTTNTSLADPIFNVSVGKGEALRLRRFSEMYQWQERSSSRQIKTANGGTRTETTYSYEKVWSSYLINSNNFHRQREELRNPSAFPFESLSLTADPILLGSIVLSSPVTDLIQWFEPLSDISIEDIPDSQLRNRVTKVGKNGLYYGTGTNSAPVVGDTRMAFYAVAPDTISVVALYTQGQLIPFVTSRGGEILFLKRGIAAAEDLFVQAEKDNETQTWIIRFVGFALMVISILLILQPMATAVDIIPFIGDYMQGGMEKCLFPLVAVLIALPLSLFFIAIGWCFYRPAIAVPIVVASLSVSVWQCYRARKKKQEEEQQQQQEQSSTTAQQPHQQSYGQSQQTNYGSPYGQQSASTYYTQSQPATTSTSIPFSQAMDAPPPSVQPTAPPAEPEIDTSQPTAEPEINMSSGMYVPSYK